jgi:hypothetical protein
MKSTDLSIPIYLNQQVVFDLLAVLDDGFSRLSTIKTSSGESETNKYGMGASIGVSNVFALLGVSFSGDRGKEKGSQEQTEINQERVHTPTSLFAKLRLRLQEMELLRSIDSSDSLKNLTSGEFIEFKALLRKNPLVENIEGLKQLAEVAELFQGEPPSSNAQKQKSGQPKGNRSQNSNTLIKRQIEGLLANLVQSNSVELIGELLDAPGVKSVLTSRLDFFSQGNALEIIDGEFRVLGKIVRVILPNSEQSINLLSKTSLGKFDKKVFDQFSQAVANSENVGLRLPEFVTEIKGPALQIIPIAIFA